MPNRGNEVTLVVDDDLWTLGVCVSGKVVIKVTQGSLLMHEISKTATVWLMFSCFGRIQTNLSLFLDCFTIL